MVESGLLICMLFINKISKGIIEFKKLTKKKREVLTYVCLKINAYAAALRRLLHY